jgi:hypothetical protein
MAFPGLKVNDVNGPIAKLGDKQALPDGVDSHVIDATSDAIETDRQLEGQRRIVFGRNG